MVAVCRDWRTAPVDEKVRAMLGFLEKLTLRPAISGGPMQTRFEKPACRTDALVDAIHVCALFSMIVRIADSLDSTCPRPTHCSRGPNGDWNSYRLVDCTHQAPSDR